MRRQALPALALTILATQALTAQGALRLAGPFDSTKTPTVEFFPGLEGSFRQQILIDAHLLKGVTNKTLTGIRLRATHVDYDHPLKGGVVDYVVKASTTSRVANHAGTLFAKNAPAATQQVVFNGAVTVPTAPRPGAGWVPWGKSNTFTIPFTKPFVYRGKTLVLDIEGRQRVKGLPEFWFLAATLIPSRGQERNYGKSCNPRRTVGGISILASKKGLVIGGMLNVTMLGRLECQPLLMIGALPIPTGIDLTPMGATGCRQYVVPFLTTPTPYTHAFARHAVRWSGLHLQIPSDLSLLGAKFYFQGIESEVHLPRSSWTNPAGLTLSEGAEVRISSQVPSSGLAVIRSHAVERTKPMPHEGDVNHESLPVMRVLYR